MTEEDKRFEIQVSPDCPGRPRLLKEEPNAGLQLQPKVAGAKQGLGLFRAGTISFWFGIPGKEQTHGENSDFQTAGWKGMHRLLRSIQLGK
jgi:hypothetical protein